VSNSLSLSLFYLAEIQLCKIRAEQHCDEEHNIGDKKLIVFSSGAKGIERVDKTEIRAGGKMYDIVKTRAINGKVLYYVLADNDEDEYVRQLTILEKNSSAQNSLPVKAVKAYEAKYFAVKNADRSPCLYFDLFTQAGTQNGPVSYPLPFKNIFSPPPDPLIA
jgi:hypothetical protein